MDEVSTDLIILGVMASGYLFISLQHKEMTGETSKANIKFYRGCGESLKTGLPPADHLPFFSVLDRPPW